MYLKSLELHGFKSFPDRTLLRFNDGATVIVGPNGSGKSNITDAMKWVLGELSSRSIRGSKMEDVIFAGADGMKPMSFAEVSVTFDNSGLNRTLPTDYDEVTATRRYYRNGDSEYFINRKKCRLKDIYELFMNTGIGREGYSIIGQGKIAELISRKNEDRRKAFEESAGISKYRYKKNESEKKLKETEDNMARVEDIEHELAQRIGPLSRDSEKARKYLELFAEKKKIDVSMWIYEAERLAGAIGKAERDLELSGHELEMQEDTISVTSSKLERLQEQSQNEHEEQNRSFDDITRTDRLLSAAKADIDIKRLEAEHAEELIESEKQRIEGARSSRSAEQARLDELKAKADALAASLSVEKELLRGISEESAGKSGTVEKLRASVEELLVRKQELDSEISDLKVRQSVLQKSTEDDEKRSLSINQDIEKYGVKLEELNREADDAQSQVEDYSSAISEIDSKVAAMKARLSELTGEYEASKEDERKKQSEFDSIESRVSVLRRMMEHFDGYNNSVRYVMGLSKDGRLKGIHGPLSHLIKVSGEHVLAIETSLGSALQNIVTEDEESAKKAIAALKEASQGRATFYPITTVRPQERSPETRSAEKAAGFIGWGDSLVSCDRRYRDIVSSLLSRVAVFDDLDHATEAARACGWRLRCVTSDGQQISSGGAFTGGQAKRDSGMLSRASQISSLEQELKQVSGELDSLTERNAGLAEEIKTLSDTAGTESERRELLLTLMSSENKRYSEADGERKALENLISSIRTDLGSISDDRASMSTELMELEELIAGRLEQSEKVQEERMSLAQQMGEVENEIADLERKAQAENIRIAEILRDTEANEAQQADILGRISQIEEEIRAHEDRIEASRGRIARTKEAVSEDERAVKELGEKLEQLQARKEQLIRSVTDTDAQISALGKLKDEQIAKKEILIVANEKNRQKTESLRADEEKLSAKMWEDYEFTFAQAKKFAEENDCEVIAEGQRSSFALRQTELKNAIKALGHVNVNAIEEYKEVKERYENIKTQLDDLRASREDLTKVLLEVESSMKEIFLDAFAKINTYFGEVFRELFGGGHAEVVLSDADNPLECDIEINAAPPGKTIKNLNLLSGGEQSFIAIALLFALIRVNPSPFCIFDEIEAALDEANVARVGRYVKKYSREMQIIMISHRRGTMDIADTLYGVTMQTSGVSKVFTLSAGDSAEGLVTK